MCVCACWSLASNSSRAVRKVKQTRVIFPFSSTSTSHLLSQTNSRVHNRWAINNGCCGRRLFWLWTHHRADAATQLVHEFEQRVKDMIAAGFACTRICWRWGVDKCSSWCRLKVYRMRLCNGLNASVQQHKLQDKKDTRKQQTVKIHLRHLQQWEYCSYSSSSDSNHSYVRMDADVAWTCSQCTKGRQRGRAHGRRRMR